MRLTYSTLALGLLTSKALGFAVSIVFLSEYEQDGERCSGELNAVCEALPEDECCGFTGNDAVASAIDASIYKANDDDPCPNGNERIALRAFSGQADGDRYNPCAVGPLSPPSPACQIQDDAIQGASWFNDIVRKSRSMPRTKRAASLKCRKPDYYTWRVNGTVYETGNDGFEHWSERNLDGFLSIASPAGTLRRRQVTAQPPSEGPPGPICLRPGE